MEDSDDDFEPEPTPRTRAAAQKKSTAASKGKAKPGKLTAQSDVEYSDTDDLESGSEPESESTKKAMPKKGKNVDRVHLMTREGRRRRGEVGQRFTRTDIQEGGLRFVGSLPAIETVQIVS